MRKSLMIAAVLSVFSTIIFAQTQPEESPFIGTWTTGPQERTTLDPTTGQSHITATEEKLIITCGKSGFVVENGNDKYAAYVNDNALIVNVFIAGRGSFMAIGVIDGDGSLLFCSVFYKKVANK